MGGCAQPTRRVAATRRHSHPFNVSALRAGGALSGAVQRAVDHPFVDSVQQCGRQARSGLAYLRANLHNCDEHLLHYPLPCLLACQAGSGGGTEGSTVVAAFVDKTQLHDHAGTCCQLAGQLGGQGFVDGPTRYLLTLV